MSFVTDTVGNVVGGITGTIGADAAIDAAEIQAEASALSREDLLAGQQQGQEFLAPFSQIGEQGLSQASFLTDPKAQFDFLQNNPLFQLGLDNANEQTLKSAASRGRLSAGDTLQQLNQNALLTASPLITNQQNAIQNLLGQGFNVAQTQANTALGTGSQLADQQTQLGNALASGQIGSANALTQGAQNIAGIAATAFSDPSLKTNIQKLGVENGFNVYSWDWNELALGLGLKGSSKGVMADEVKKTRPEAVIVDGGFMKVDYNLIGVNH